MAIKCPRPLCGGWLIESIDGVSPLRIELRCILCSRTPLDKATKVRQRMAAKGQTFDTVEEVQRSREELGARLVTNYLDDGGNVVAGGEKII